MAAVTNGRDALGPTKVRSAAPTASVTDESEVSLSARPTSPDNARCGSGRIVDAAAEEEAAVSGKESEDNSDAPEASRHDGCE